MPSKEKRALKMKENPYVFMSGVLFRRNYDGNLLICLPIEETHDILKEMDEGVCGGPFAPKVNAYRIIKSRHYWPTIFKDSYTFIRKCSACQKLYGQMKREAMHLHPILVDAPFMQWGLDVIGPINPKSSQGHAYILTTIDYFTKWQVARVLKKVGIDDLISFIEENILSWFGVPEKIITNNDTIFIGSKFTAFCGKYEITMGKSWNYYPKGNGLEESTNKTLVQVLKKIILENQRN